MGLKWSFASESRKTQDRLIRAERDQIELNEQALRRGRLDPASERNAKRNVENSRRLLRDWTGRDS